MQYRRLIGSMVTCCGIILMLISVFSKTLFQQNLGQYYNVKEASIVYGLMLCILGIVLMFCKRISVLKVLWGMWSYLCVVQMLRFLPMQIFVSHLMNSVEIFWGVLGFGFVLLNVSLWWKYYKIF